ncbi:MAG TPA: hypothetical protein VF121_09375 [Thermoanaerobaculia bacterium]|nr:hypothetical protein [Thermoanaerobaculia bacterium]
MGRVRTYARYAGIRTNELAGIEITRVTGTRLEREPAEVIARLSRLLATRPSATGRKPT